MRHRGTLFFLLAVLLGGCTVVHGGVCPPIKVYTKEEQKQAGVEFRALPPGSVIGRWIIDYKSERDQLRACQ